MMMILCTSPNFPALYRALSVSGAEMIIRLIFSFCFTQIHSTPCAESPIMGHQNINCTPLQWRPRQLPTLPLLPALSSNGLYLQLLTMN